MRLYTFSVDAEGNPVVEVKKRGRKKKPEDPNFVKRPPLKRGPKKKLESEKKHRVYPWFVNPKFTTVTL